MCSTANDMYKALKDLNNNGDYPNAALAWQAFVDLRADTQPSVRTFTGKFREAIGDIAVQNITLDWKKPINTGGTLMSRLEELLIIHFLHGLGRVLPQWVEARNNDLRQGQSWSIDSHRVARRPHSSHSRGARESFHHRHQASRGEAHALPDQQPQQRSELRSSCARSRTTYSKKIGLRSFDRRCKGAQVPHRAPLTSR